jgi:hypothetical protein
MSKRKLPQFATYSECKRFIFQTRNNAHLRYGQALCNRFEIPKDLEDKIWEEKDFHRVVQAVWNYTNRPEYQNA